MFKDMKLYFVLKIIRHEMPSSRLPQAIACNERAILPELEDPNPPLGHVTPDLRIKWISQITEMLLLLTSRGVNSLSRGH